jgi:hypothetical protein
MKKLLLFALVMGLGTMSFAQTTNFSVESILTPTGTITTEDPANGTTILSVSVTNNDAAITFPIGTVLTFNVSLEGLPVDNVAPGGAAIPWIASLSSLPIAPGETQNFVLSQTWGAAPSTIGTHELCIELVSIFDITTTPAPTMYTNADQNKELCQDYNFAWPLGINDVVSEISNIKTNGDVMTISVTNNSNQAQIQLMSVTGQVVKTVNTSAAGQNFTQEINISDLTSGVYVVTIQNENGASIAQKVFIQ